MQLDEKYGWQVSRSSVGVPVQKARVAVFNSYSVLPIISYSRTVTSELEHRWQSAPERRLTDKVMVRFEIPREAAFRRPKYRYLKGVGNSDISQSALMVLGSEKRE